MNTTIFAILCVLAVVSIFGIICLLANSRRLSKFGVILAGLAVLAIGNGLWIAYCALPHVCHCSNIFFILIEIALMLGLAVAIFDIVGKYILGVLIIAAMGYGLYWLFVNGVADNSFIGFIIAVGAVAFAALVVFGAIRSLITAVAKAK